MEKRDDEGSNGRDEDRDKVNEHDRSVSELVVRVNEPDMYTPTLDLSKDPSARGHQEMLRLSLATRPDAPRVEARRELRTNAEFELERSRDEEARAVGELRSAVAQYERETGKWLPWAWGFLAVVLVVLIVAFFGDPK